MKLIHDIHLSLYNHRRISVCTAEHGKCDEHCKLNILQAPAASSQQTGMCQANPKMKIPFSYIIIIILLCIFGVCTLYNWCVYKNVGCCVPSTESTKEQNTIFKLLWMLHRKSSHDSQIIKKNK